MLECIPSEIAKIITSELDIPTIGIGAGKDCDGQVLVTNDMLGLFDRFLPKFAKRYIKLNDKILEAISTFKKEVEEGAFPAPEHEFTIKKEELEKI